MLAVTCYLFEKFSSKRRCLRCQEQRKVQAAEGWEYAPFFNMKFHHKERKMDLVRRRRWHCKMVAESLQAPCFFQLRNQEVINTS